MEEKGFCIGYTADHAGNVGTLLLGNGWTCSGMEFQQLYYKHS